jgi:teichuronic acid exporter
MSIGKQIYSGVVWTTIQTVVNRTFGFVIKLVLARILFPEDYGIIGMAAVFTGFVQVFSDFGMGAALIQRKDENLTEAHYHTAFWTGLVWSVVIYLIVSLAVAPFAAWFYKEDILKKIIPVLSIGILASPFSLVHSSQLTKALDFKRLALISNASSVFSGFLSLVLALLGFGVWALVFNSVTIFIITLPLYFRATGWLPKFIWQKDCFKDIFGFGIYTTGTQLLSKFASQIDYLLVGKFLGAASLGIYSFAFILTDTFRSQLMMILNKVMYPIYSKLQNDRTKLIHYYYQVVLYNAIVIYPIMFFLVYFGDYLIPQVFGDKWNEAVLPIKVLAVSVVIHVLVGSNTSLMRAIGKPGLELKLQIIKTLLFFVPFVTIGTIYFGLIGTSVGYLIAKVFTVTLSSIVMKTILKMNIKKLILNVIPPVVISITAGIASVALTSFFNQPIVAMLVYVLIVMSGNIIMYKDEFKKMKVNFFN